MGDVLKGWLPRKVKAGHSDWRTLREVA